MERISEGDGAYYFYLLTGKGVGEGEALSMQIHPLSWGVAIEGVAEDRTS